jgi:Protein of unknown function (DUF1176)
MPIRRAACLAPLLAFTVQPALAQEERYLDDRSNAAALVRSLYNAVNRREFARAWSYFGDTKPSEDFQAFVDGYAGTERVEVETGGVSEEGAAGSIYFSVPTAIRAIGKDGSEKVFAGCYATRLINPQMQDTVFTPLHIEKGTLQPAQGDLADALPKSCGDAPLPPVKDTLLERAREIFTTGFAESCESLKAGSQPGADPESHTIAFRFSYEPGDKPERQARLFRFECGIGAYNTSQVYYFADDAGELRQLQFATPELEVRYENDDPEGKVEQISIVGYTAASQLVNSTYDPDTRSIESLNKWRGVGDASAAGKWIFREGDFTLVSYEVDAAYDGEVSREPVLDFDTGP